MAPPTMHVGEFVRGKGKFLVTEYVTTRVEMSNAKFPLILTTGRIPESYNVGAQTRRTENNQWHDEDRLEIHPHDAEERGIANEDWVGIRSRSRRNRTARTRDRTCATGRCVHDFPLPGVRCERHYDRQL